MAIEDKLYDIEKGFWTEGAAHYRAHVDDQCLTVFAEMAALLERDKIAESAGDHRWSDLSMTRRGFLNAVEDFAVISYEASAKRAGRTYRALVSSGYVRRGQDWRMAFHQQTPLDSK
jgi:uncharacterized protein YchJ